MTLARRTEGSKRVSTANHPISPSVAAHRARCWRRRSPGAATARRKATFWPETALKSARPDARKASTSSRGWPRSSPTTNPRYRLRSIGSMVRAPCSRSRRARLAERARAVPSPTKLTRVTSTTLTMWRARSAAGVAPGRRAGAPSDVELLAGAPRAEPAGAPAEGAELHVAVPADRFGHDPRPEGAGIGQQGDDTGERGRPRRRGAGPGVGRQHAWPGRSTPPPR